MGAKTGAVLLLAVLVEGGQPAVPSRDWRTQQTAWWSEDRLLKDAIVSTAHLVAERRDLQSAPPFVEHASDVLSLVLLFDSRQSEESLGTLASLNSYYLGESAGEIYRCLLLRKGGRIRPQLARLESEAPTECLQRFGKGNTCLTQEAAQRRLAGILSDIERNAPCTIEQ